MSTSNATVPFNRPFLTGKELVYLQQALQSRHLSGDGAFTKKCNAWLEENTKAHKALLTHSCTAALEMAALLMDLKPGDEVILPSFTFVSTANAIALRGATPVFVDIRQDTLNLDERLLERAITTATRGIFVVHYAGVGAEMDTINAVAAAHQLTVVEDAAQGIMALDAPDRGDAVELLARARANLGGWCVFYAPSSAGQGRCTQYAWRPVVCRLFGFSGVRGKRGLELAVCWQLYEAQPATMLQAQQDVEDGRIPMPVFEDLHRRVAVVAGALGQHPQPINTALCLALEHVLGAR